MAVPENKDNYYFIDGNWYNKHLGFKNAKYIASTVKNCIGCIDCRECSNCMNCIECFNCHSCLDSYNLDYCINCIHCTYSSFASDKYDKNKYSPDVKQGVEAFEDLLVKFEKELKQKTIDNQLKIW